MVRDELGKWPNPTGDSGARSKRTHVDNNDNYDRIEI